MVKSFLADWLCVPQPAMVSTVSTTSNSIVSFFNAILLLI